MLTLELKKEECEVLSSILGNYSRYLSMETTLVSKGNFEAEIRPQIELINKIQEQLSNARSLDL